MASSTIPAGWTLGEHHGQPALTRQWRFAHFSQAVGAVMTVMVEAERLNHHPDVEWSWTTVRFWLTSHDQGAVTARDIALAERINTLLEEGGTAAR